MQILGVTIVTTFGILISAIPNTNTHVVKLNEIGKRSWQKIQKIFSHFHTCVTKNIVDLSTQAIGKEPRGGEGGKKEG